MQQSYSGSKQGVVQMKSPLELQQEKISNQRSVSFEEEKLETKLSSRRLLKEDTDAGLLLSYSKRNTMRNVAEGIPEIHFMGEIRKGREFENSNCSITCKWSIDWGQTWSLLAGEKEGQSQFAFPSTNGDCIWNHPIDVHFTTANMKGWPRILLQIWNLDAYGRTNLLGYAFTHLPSSHGMHVIKLSCWRPKGTLGEEIMNHFLGTSIHLNRDSLIFDEASENRKRLVTIPTGQVELHLHTIARYFDIHKVN